MSTPLVEPLNFLRATRDAGYISTTTAISELIDNAIQARASLVEIAIEPDADGTPQITLRDDGEGMSKTELSRCLLFGGSSRFDNRSGLGRYGMGLPTASLSQARAVSVKSARGGGRWFEVSLDLDEILAGSRLDAIPRPVRPLDPPGTTSGTTVTWRRCDRIEYKRLSWLVKSLVKDLGRVFRTFLTAGMRIHVNGQVVEPVDPLMLTHRGSSPHASLLCEPLCYEFAGSTGVPASVRVTFSELPVRALHHLDNTTKKREGIVGAGGMSVLRAGREIAYGWHLFGDKRKENYDDWWRCELSFPPELDELFGITYTKQGIRPTPPLTTALAPAMEKMARLCNARVRQEFEAIRFGATSGLACRIAEDAESDLGLLPRSDARRQTEPLRYALDAAPLDPTRFIEFTLADNALAVLVNSDHAAFGSLYGALRDTSDPEKLAIRTAVELLFLSFARSHLALEVAKRGDARKLLELWSATLATMLRHS